MDRLAPISRLLSRRSHIFHIFKRQLDDSAPPQGQIVAISACFGIDPTNVTICAFKYYIDTAMPRIVKNNDARIC